VAPKAIVSTVAPNGDLSPRGVGFVPGIFNASKSLKSGDLLVTNFNNSANLPGTGSTIVRIQPNGNQSVFYQGPPGMGFTAGIGFLQFGFEIVTALPSTNGTPATAGQGELLVIDNSGNVVTTFADPNLLDGPWDLTVVDQKSTAQVFVSNVLSGTITRISLTMPSSGGVFVTGATQIASGFPHSGDPNAFEVGPGGLVFDPVTRNLYVASEADDSIYAIPHALGTTTDNGTGTLLVHDPVNLHGPMGLTMSSSGHLIVANSDAVNANPNDPSTLVEYTRRGQLINTFSTDPNPGAAFGVTITPGPAPLLAAVNDNHNSVTVWHVHGLHPVP
jgi:hypothetical protein